MILLVVILLLPYPLFKKADGDVITWLNNFPDGVYFSWGGRLDYGVDGNILIVRGKNMCRIADIPCNIGFFNETTTGAYNNCIVIFIQGDMFICYKQLIFTKALVK